MVLLSRYIGPSPSGKATDFDSVISLVRIQLAQPKDPAMVCHGGIFSTEGFASSRSKSRPGGRSTSKRACGRSMWRRFSPLSPKNLLRAPTEEQRQISSGMPFGYGPLQALQRIRSFTRQGLGAVHAPGLLFFSRFATVPQWLPTDQPSTSGWTALHSKKPGRRPGFSHTAAAFVLLHKGSRSLRLFGRPCPDRRCVGTPRFAPGRRCGMLILDISLTRITLIGRGHVHRLRASVDAARQGRLGRVCPALLRCGWAVWARASALCRPTYHDSRHRTM